MIPSNYRERMWESWFHSPVKIILDSLKILISNKLVFISILIFTALPLSTLTISQSFFLHSRATQIYHLEMLARFSHTRFEARHVWQESRLDALSLLRIKALLFSLPSFLLSLSSAISSVHSSLSIPTLRSAAKSLSLSSFKRPFLTSFFVYAILFVFSPLRIAFSAFTGSSRFIFNAISLSLQIYLMAVLSLAIVVSIAEDRYGWDAIRVGSGIMEGRRFCGWVLSGLLVMASRVIGWKVEELLEGQVEPPEFLGLTDFEKGKGIIISTQEKAVLIGCYSLVVLFSYVVMTVYYSDCRKRHPVKEAPNSDDDHHHHHELHSLSL